MAQQPAAAYPEQASVQLASPTIATGPKLERPDSEGLTETAFAAIFHASAATELHRRLLGRLLRDWVTCSRRRATLAFPEAMGGYAFGPIPIVVVYAR